MTRLFGLAADRRAAGIEPRAVFLTRHDEAQLFASVEPTFGAAGAEAAARGEEAWRTFLVQWFEHTVKLALRLDAETTRVE